MSFGYASDRDLTPKTLPANPYWTRPSEWLTLTPVGAVEQKFTGLIAIMPDNELNYVSMNITGAVTIDWGDGVVENIASGVNALHQYDYATATNLTSYGYKQAIVTVTPQVANNITNINLRVKPPAAGTQVQYIVRWLDIELGSPNLSALTIGANNSVIGLTMLERFRWASKGAGLTSFSDFLYWCTNLQEIIIDADMSNVTSFSAFFYNCSKLKYGPRMNISTTCTSIPFMFGNCYELITVPNYDFTNVSNMSNAFENCFKLTTLQLRSTANVTNMNAAFRNCYKLTNISTIDALRATNLSNVFTNCRVLPSVTVTNAGNCNTFLNMFSGCSNLKNASVTGNLVNAANSSMVSMFNLCSSLEQVVLLDTSRSNNMNGMFTSCSALESVPNLDTSNNITFSSMFSGCSSLNSVGNLDTSKGTLHNSMFLNCVALKEALPFNLSNSNSVQSMYTGCSNINLLPAYNLANVTAGGGSIISSGVGLGAATPLLMSNVTNLRFSTTYVNCGIQRANLETIMNNLSSAGAASQGINISGNPGTDTAVAKTGVGFTSGSNVVTMANTVGLSVGMIMSPIANITTVAGTLTVTNTITLPMQLPNNTMVSLANVATSNLPVNTIFYTSYFSGSPPSVNHKLSLTPGGSDIVFTSGTGNLRLAANITQINTNSNVILNYNASNNASSQSPTFRILNTNIAILKGWSVTG